MRTRLATQQGCLAGAARASTWIDRRTVPQPALEPLVRVATCQRARSASASRRAR